MAEVGAAAAAGRAPGEETIAQMRQLSRAAPLSADPYLIAGAMAMRRGDYALAEQLFVHARARAPRSPAARFVLADLYLRTGRAVPAIAEMAILNRLLPGASGGLASSLAAYARTPGTFDQLRAVLSAYPELEPGLLAELATDPRNAGLILALARPQASAGELVEWQQRLFATLIQEGAYERAYAIWRKLSGVQAEPGGLFNPSFSSNPAPPPFDWEFPRITGGVAEARPGALHILYFGRENLVFARQVLLLRPGSYRLEMRVSGKPDEAGSVRWVLTCMGGGTQLLELPLGAQAGAGQVSGRFTVPQDCPAQQLELKAEAQEFPERSELQIAGVQLLGGPPR